jgi:ribose transport system ATP-binding protein
MSAAVLTVEAVNKTFGAVRALADVSIEIGRNEVVGLVGENGAGKSTLMKLFGGVYQPDNGKILHEGKPIVLHSPLDAARAGIGMVHQEQSLLLNISVAENIYLGREQAFLRFGAIDWRAMHTAARRQLAKVSLDIDPARRTSGLTFAERQMVELAKALVLEEETDGHIVVFLDEPTSVLEQAEIDILFSRVRALRSRASFVFVSHRIDEILHLSDRVYVMKDGAVVAGMPVADASEEKLHRLMVGAGRRTEYYREDRQTAYAPKIALRASDLGCAGHYRGVSFELHEGEVLAIAGVIGSGREGVVRTLAGLLAHDAGTLEVDGHPVLFRAPDAAVRAGVGYVPQERRVEGVVLPMSMAANITLPSLRRMSHWGVLGTAGERTLAREWVKRLTIRPPNIDLPCGNLSGGNQQKVVLAKWIGAGVRVLVLDHPTRGLDVGAKQDVYDLVRTIGEQGVAVLLTADTLEETIGLAHTILVMRDGVVTQRFTAAPGHKPAQLDLIRHMV